MTSWRQYRQGLLLVGYACAGFFNGPRIESQENSIVFQSSVKEICVLTCTRPMSRTVNSQDTLQFLIRYWPLYWPSNRNWVPPSSSVWIPFDGSTNSLYPRTHRSPRSSLSLLFLQSPTMEKMLVIGAPIHYYDIFLRDNVSKRKPIATRLLGGVNWVEEIPHHMLPLFYSSISVDRRLRALTAVRESEAIECDGRWSTRQSW